MKEYEITLAMKMITYSIFCSQEEIKNSKVGDVIYKLSQFFSQEVLDEAKSRLIKANE